MQSEERVHLFLDRQGRHQWIIWVLVGDIGEQRLGGLVAGLAVEGEFQIVGDVVMAGIDQRLVRQDR